SYSYKDLVAMAKRRGVEGWHAMRKEQLVKALSRAAARPKTAHSKSAIARNSKKPAAVSRRSSAISATSSGRKAAPKLSPAAQAKKNRVLRQLEEQKTKKEQSKSLATGPSLLPLASVAPPKPLFGKVNEQPKSNGTAKLNGAAKTNGTVKTNGAVKTN